jgi:hypothetical protein
LSGYLEKMSTSNSSKSYVSAPEAFIITCVNILIQNS